MLEANPAHKVGLLMHRACVRVVHMLVWDRDSSPACNMQ